VEPKYVMTQSITMVRMMLCIYAKAIMLIPQMI